MIKSLEQHHFKLTIATAVAVIVSLMSMTYTLSTWKSDMELGLKTTLVGVNHVGEVQDALNARIVVLETQDTLTKIQVATIETRLTNIEALLIELREGQKLLMNKA